MVHLPRALRAAQVDGVKAVLRLDSGMPGPHAVVVALLHGNETCGLGAIRAVLAREAELLRGRVTLIAANPAGFRARRPDEPQAGRFLDEDMNRLWSADRLAGAGADTIEMRRAREIASLFGDADLVVDLHSMATPGPRLLMFHDTPGARAVLPALPADAHRIRFVSPLHEGRLLVEQPALLGDPRRAAFVVECGAHRAPAASTYAARVALAALGGIGMLAKPARQPRRRKGLDLVAVQMLRAGTDSFRFLDPPIALRVYEPGAPIAEDGARVIRAPFSPTVLMLARARPRRGGEAGLLGHPATD
jgi:predicted deacylase